MTFPPDGVAPCAARKKQRPGGGLETAAQSKVGQRIAATDRKTAAFLTARVFSGLQSGVTERDAGRHTGQGNTEPGRKLQGYLSCHLFCMVCERGSRNGEDSPGTDTSGHGERERLSPERGTAARQLKYRHGRADHGKVSRSLSEPDETRRRCGYAASGMAGQGSTPHMAADGEGTGSSRGG